MEQKIVLVLVRRIDLFLLVQKYEIVFITFLSSESADKNSKAISKPEH